MKSYRRQESILGSSVYTCVNVSIKEQVSVHLRSGKYLCRLATVQFQAQASYGLKATDESQPCWYGVYHFLSCDIA